MAEDAANTPAPQVDADWKPERDQPSVSEGSIPDADEAAPESEIAVPNHRVSVVESRPVGRRFVLGAILILALALRVLNVDWDSGQHQHPDERHWNIVSAEIAAPDGVSGERGYFDSEVSPLNPYNYDKSWVYGTGPLAVNKAVSTWMLNGARDGGFPAATVVSTLDALGVPLKNDVGDPAFDNGYNSHVPGRLLSALADTLTVLAVYLLTRRLFDRGTALLAAGLQATVALHIQYSHFFGSETWAALFVTVSVIGAVQLARFPRRGSAIMLAGVALGLAVATKLTAVVAGPVVVLAPLIGMFGAGVPRDWPSRLRHLWGAAESAMTAGLLALITFRIAQPYAFAGRWTWRLDGRFMEDLSRLADLVDGAEFPPNLQWINRTPLVYPLSQLFRWGLGPFLALAAAAGMLLTIWKLRSRAARVASLEPAVPLVLVGVMLAMVWRQPNPTLRYMLPVYPTLVVFAAGAIVWLWRRGGQPARLGAVAIALLAGLWGLAFTNGIYGQPHTRITASEWMVENMPADSVISYQVWDDGLPLNLPSTQGHSITWEQFEPFNPDSTAKVDLMIDSLDRVDFVVESSNRVYDSVSRIPARYPSTIAYYDALFEERLGFELVAEFSNHPGLLGLEFDDSHAEEAFSVYDHPTVTIWQKTPEYSRQLARAVLDPDRAQSGVFATPGQADENAAMLRPDAYQTQQSGGSFSEVFGDGTGATSSFTWLWWIVLLQVAALASLPWVTWVFRRLFGAGYGLSKPLGLFAIAIPVWLTVSWGVADFSRGLVGFWFLVAVIGGGLLAWRRRTELTSTIRGEWQAWLLGELVFLGVLGLMLWMRSTNPDLWNPWRGGEKPMELAHLTAVTKSTTLPPFDPWFAGGSLNYFYFGFFILAVPIRLLKILPEVGFNLGISTYAAFTAAITFTTVSSLVDVTRRAVTRAVAAVPGTTAAGAVSERRPRSLKPGLWGVFGVIVLMVAGNYAALRQHLDHFRAAREQGAVGLGSFFTREGLPRFDWWAPSRVNEGTFDITEFPAWSFLFADLHPHVMGLVPLGLVVVIALTYVLSVIANDTRHALVVAVGLGLATGVVRMLNTWDYPTTMLIAAGTVMAARLAATDGSAALRQRLMSGGRDLVAFFFVHVLFVAPFTANMRIYDSGVTRTPVNTPLSGYLLQFTFPTLIIGTWLCLRLFRSDVLKGREPAERAALGFFAGGAACLVGTILVAAAPESNRIVFVIAGLLVVLGLTVMVSELSAGRVVEGFAAAIGTLGFAIVLGVEVVAIDNDIERLNTVFKFWYQAWHLLALASAFAVADGMRLLGWRKHVPAPARAQTPIWWFTPARGGWVGMVGVLVLLALTFPLLSVGPRLGDRFPGVDPAPTGLDGLAYLNGDPIVAPEGIEVAIGDDLAMITWLRANAVGSPTMVEAVGGGYQWPGRFAITTGLPAVVGWHHHENQQRRDFEAAVGQRRIDTENFWTSADPVQMQSYLRRYDVTYVLVGTEEVNRATPQMRAALDLQPYLERVWSSGDFRVFEVDKWAIRDASPSVELGPLVHIRPPGEAASAARGASAGG